MATAIDGWALATAAKDNLHLYFFFLSEKIQILKDFL